MDAQRLHVLDAGCGRRRINGRTFEGAYVVGIDVDEVALALNDEVDEKIYGDIQTYPLEPAAFDAVTCTDVLEHLPHPERALANLARALRPGGELYVDIPNLDSPKAVVTKLTPHRFHVWFYRRVVGDPHAGTPQGGGPFRTYLRRSLRPGALAQTAQAAGLELVSVEYVEAPFFIDFWRRHRFMWAAVRAVWRVLRLGDPAATDCVVVMRKPSA